MTKSLLLSLAVAAFAVVAGAQEFPSEPHEFIIAKMAAAEGRYDDALSRLDRIIEKTPNDSVLRFERAMILIDAGRLERAESEMRTVVTASPDFFDAQRVLGRLLLDRAGTD
ncbi:MAG TPA: tetratricopeptide repeat protein, partial [Thermoanaerobaculia bacterium]|nr:tetratricopeptide repeat protein [Thermoanaerobaculia bacterium]